MSKVVELIKKELVIAEKERDQFAMQANQQLAFLNGRVSKLEELLKKLESDESPLPGGQNESAQEP